jgi:hypothetical protein
VRKLLEAETTEYEGSAARHTDWFGVVLGAITFLLGIGLLVFTFFQAAEMFSIPASTAVGAANKDITEIGASFGNVILRIGLLLVMCIVGSIVSGKGVRMYLAARARTHGE